MNKWQVTITGVELWSFYKWSGLVIFILSLVGLLTGSWPDHHGSSLGNGLRWVFWPLMLVWLLGLMIKGLFF